MIKLIELLFKIIKTKKIIIIIELYTQVTKTEVNKKN